MIIRKVQYNSQPRKLKRMNLVTVEKANDSSYTIKNYSEEYKEKVIEFFMKICIDEFGFKEWEEDIKNMDNHTYESDGGNFWIAVDKDNNVIGTIGLRNKGQSIGELKSMYVHKHYRGQNVAQKLLETLLEFAIKYERIILDTYKKFERAIGFYEKNGFYNIEQIGDKLIYEKFIRNSSVDEISC